MADWLSGCKVTAAAMEATGIYWEAPLDALEAAGIRPLVLNAQHVKQVRGRKTDVGDSVWLARVCGLAACSPTSSARTGGASSTALPTGAILAELGPDIGMFASHAHCAAWAGLCPGNNESGGRRSGRARKGNPALRRVLVERAHAASRTKDCQFHSHFRALRTRKSCRQAVFATARKLVRVIHAVLKNRKPARIPEPTAGRS